MSATRRDGGAAVARPVVPRRPMPVRCRSPLRSTRCAICRAPMRPRCSPACSTGWMRKSGSRCSRWRPGGCASACRRVTPRPRWRRRSAGCRCGGGGVARPVAPYASLFAWAEGKGRNPPRRTCRSSAPSCSRTGWRMRRSTSPIMPPSGNGTASRPDRPCRGPDAPVQPHGDDVTGSFPDVAAAFIPPPARSMANCW